jgi:hypothetical protein
MMTMFSPPVIAMWAIVYVGIFFVSVWLLKYLWNMTIPQIFDIRIISFWQSFRLALICMILFGNQISSFAWGVAASLSTTFMF